MHPTPAELRLGVVLDGDLKWEQELIEIEGKAYICPLKSFKPQEHSSVQFNLGLHQISKFRKLK